MSFRATPCIAAARIRKLSRLRPTLALVLGSGFNAVRREVEVEACVPYAELPGFPALSVAGHDGECVIGRLSGTPVLVLSGRAHYYEGHPMERVTFPIRVLAALGIGDLLLTNAAGAINRRFRPGDFMLLTDHLNFMGVNPLRGAATSESRRFVDLTRVYDAILGARLAEAARAGGIRLRRGVYVAVGGPSYETPAEIRAFARLGADAVGMSTVPEALVARQCGLRVAAVSCLTNPAAGLGRRELSHADVLQRMARMGKLAAALLKNFARLYQACRPPRGGPGRLRRPVPDRGEMSPPSAKRDAGPVENADMSTPSKTGHDPGAGTHRRGDRGGLDFD